jgi:hypothetical protein
VPHEGPQQGHAGTQIGNLHSYWGVGPHYGPILGSKMDPNYVPHVVTHSGPQDGPIMGSRMALIMGPIASPLRARFWAPLWAHLWAPLWYVPHDDGPCYSSHYWTHYGVPHWHFGSQCWPLLAPFWAPLGAPVCAPLLPSLWSFIMGPIRSANLLNISKFGSICRTKQV